MNDTNNQRYDPENPIGTLEEKHVINMILFLKKNGKCKKTDIYFSISLNSRMATKLDRMEEAGLITQTLIGNTGRTDVELTPLGLQVADILGELNDLLLPPKEPEDEIEA